MATGIEHFEIETNASMYVPGSVVEGNVRIRTTKSLLCSGIILKAFGETLLLTDCPTPIKTHQLTFYQRSMTLLGGKYRTECGALRDRQVSFATKMAPDGGVLHIPCSNRERRFQMQIVGESNGRSQILGAAWFSPNSVIDNCRSKKEMHLPLTQDGATVTANVRFRAAWCVDKAGQIQEMRLNRGPEISRVVKLDIVDAEISKMSKESGSWDGLYCKIIVESEATQNDGNQIRVSPIDVRFPFALKLPKKLPTSIDADQGIAVRYSLQCSLCEAEVSLPSAVSHFGVLNKSAQNYPTVGESKTTKKTRPSLMPCVVPSHPQVLMTTSLDRSTYAPGMPVQIQIEGQNALRVPLAIRVDLTRVHHLHAVQESLRSTYHLIPPVGVARKKKFRFNWSVPLPQLPPTYQGNGRGKEPLTWEYQLEIIAEAKDTVVMTQCFGICVTAEPGDCVLMDVPLRSMSKKLPKTMEETHLASWHWPLAVTAIADVALKRSTHPRQTAVNKQVQCGKCQEVPFQLVYTPV